MVDNMATPQREHSLGHYMKGTCLGKGGQGTVYEYRYASTEQKFAVKILRWKPDQSNRLSIIQEAFLSIATKDGRYHPSC